MPPRERDDVIEVAHTPFRIARAASSASNAALLGAVCLPPRLNGP